MTIWSMIVVGLRGVELLVLPIALAIPQPLFNSWFLELNLESVKLAICVIIRPLRYIVLIQPSAPSARPARLRDFKTLRPVLTA